MVDGCSLEACLHKGKTATNKAVDFVRCCLCASWYHTDCVGVKDDEEIGVWPCMSCRTLPSDVRKLQTTLDTRQIAISALSSSNSYLQKTLDECKDKLRVKTEGCDQLIEQINDLRCQLAKMAEDRNLNTWQNFRPQKALVVGDSLLRDLDENKLNQTKVVSIPGANCQG